MDKSKIIKYVRNFALFVGLIILTFWIILKDQDSEEFIQIIKNSSWKFILIGALTMFGFLCLEAINIRQNVKAFRRKVMLYTQLKICIDRIFL